MTTGKQVGRVATKSSFVPVLLPVFLLSLVAGAGRIAQEVVQPRHGSQATLTPSEANPTEATFLGYKRVGELCSGDEPGALALLQSLVQAPLSVRGNTFRSQELAAFSPQVLLMDLIQSSMKRALIAAERGDNNTASVYGESLRQIGDRLLLDSAPSVTAIQTAHRFHCAAARIQARIQGNEPETVAQYQEAMLREVWKTRFAPLLAKHVPCDDAQSEVRFAAQVVREYQEACSRIRAGEA